MAQTKKIFDLKIKSLGTADGLKEGEFLAYASVFGNKDSYGDVVLPGAFLNSIAAWKASGNTIPVLFGHNMGDPDYNIGGVIEATEDDHGLLIHGFFDMESPKGATVYRAVKGRRISQLSFAFDVIDSAYAKSEELGEYLELRELKLYEISFVTIGANQETEVLGVKSTEIDGLKAGKTLSAKSVASITSARENASALVAHLDELLLANSANEDTAKAAASVANEQVIDEESLGGTKSDDKPVRSTNASTLATTLKLLALKN
jgi:HK97 family phage prohead protease